MISRLEGSLPEIHALAATGLSLPAGARATWAKGFLVEAPRGAPPRLSWWSAPPLTGTPLMWSDEGDMTWVYFGSQHPRTRTRDALSPDWLLRLLTSPEVANDLSGVFALAVLHKPTRQVLIVSDRLGVQAVHYGSDDEATWRASTHLLWLLLANRHDGSVDASGFLTHMAFGYGVEPHRRVYRGIDVTAPSGFIRFSDGPCESGVYWEPPEPLPGNRLSDATALVDALRTAAERPMPGVGLFLGITAGKDSLCLASIAPPAMRLQTGTLGVTGCDDRVQGEQIADHLGWPHVSAGVCSAEDFFEWADFVAFQSAGLSTVSYVDMAAFVATHVPRGSAFVMGEGGECVRDFFHAAGRSSLQMLQEEYMTPGAYLRETLASPLLRRLADYPASVLSEAQAFAGRADADAFVSFFYRFRRMPGNFSLRHAVLSALRPKLSPFIDHDFVDATYSLSLEEHNQSAVHRRIIATARPDLLRFFEEPVRKARSTQGWPERFETLRSELGRRWAPLLALSDDVLDPRGVLALCEASATQPRSVYHLLRLYSFTLGRALLRIDPAARLAEILADRSGPPLQCAELPE